ncbi:MAG: hypothetical protein OQK09_12145 [Colwellia sp.]|nr:hypothetical protein [Colwellia sp.]MCW8864510.1 hypothetical protein [Colwellia sp.]MCW9082254.1 hypothetical protein [Colwellia sp.]
MTKIYSETFVTTATKIANQDCVFSLNERTLSPVEHLNKLIKKLPNVGKKVTDEYIKKIDPNIDVGCPKSVFINFESCINIIKDYISSNESSISEIDRISFSTLISWRYTQGTYHFSDETFAKLSNTPFDGMVTIERIQNIPEWSVYIKTPHRNDMDGFFASIDYQKQNNKTYLKLLLNTPFGLTPIPIQLGDWTIEEGLKLSFSKESSTNRYSSNQPHFDRVCRELLPLAKFCTSLVINLCTQESIVKAQENEATQPIRPQLKKTKKGFKLFPSNQPKNWFVEKSNSNKVVQIKDYQGGKHKSPKCFTRRGFYRKQWVGARGSIERKQEIRWISPTIVNGVAA